MTQETNIGARLAFDRSAPGRRAVSVEPPDEPQLPLPPAHLLRDSLRVKAEQMLAEEVNALCGESHRPGAGAQYRRAGSESGTCYAGGRRESILRPRVRKQVGNGTEREHVLASYAAMRRPANNAAAVVTALGAGMSTRRQAWASEDVMSKSAASRHWIEATAANTAICSMTQRSLIASASSPSTCPGTANPRRHPVSSTTSIP